MRVHTAGYIGAWTLATLVAKVEEIDAVVVDVRLSPRSRNPQWRGPTLASALKERYVHIREFGNVNYRLRGMHNVRLKDFVKGVAKLDLMNQPDVVLLCACRDYDHCHRSIIVDMLLEQHADRFEYEGELFPIGYKPPPVVEQSSFL